MNKKQPTQIEQDVVVTMAYELSVNGEIEEAYDEENPIVFLFGHENIIPGLEDELEGMKIGESKKVVVDPDNGYGDVVEDAIIDVPRDQFPEDIPLTIGTILELKDPDGNPMTAFITRVEGDKVVLDFNHPMAGKTLTFNVTIKDLRHGTEEEIETSQVLD